MIRTIFGRLFGGIFAFLVCILLSIGIWIAAAYAAFFNADTYINGLAEQGIYQRIVPVLFPLIANAPQADLINSDENSITLPRLLSVLPERERVEIANYFLPPEFIQPLIESAISRFFRWLDGDAVALTESFDLSALIERLRADAGQQRMWSLITVLPDCNTAQNRQIEGIVSGGSGDLPFCRPSAEFEDEVQALVNQSIDQFATRLESETVTLATLMQIDMSRPNDAQLVQDMPVVLDAVEGLLIVGYLIPLAFLSLVVAVTVRAFRSFTQWTGWIGLVSGFITFLPLLTTGAIISGAIGEMSRNPNINPQMQLFLISFVTGLLESGVGQFAAPVVMQGFVLLGAGMILLIISTVLQRRYDQERTTMAIQLATIGSTASARATDAYSGEKIKL
jgi:hypothetical protein